MLTNAAVPSAAGSVDDGPIFDGNSHIWGNLCLSLFLTSHVFGHFHCMMCWEPAVDIGNDCIGVL